MLYFIFYRLLQTVYYLLWTYTFAIEFYQVFHNLPSFVYLLLIIITLHFSIGDKAQLPAFKLIAGKMQLMPSVFDLALSHQMKKFTIHRQHRCNDSYQTFLGIFTKSLLITNIFFKYFKISTALTTYNYIFTIFLVFNIFKVTIVFHIYI